MPRKVFHLLDQKIWDDGASDVFDRSSVNLIASPADFYSVLKRVRSVTAEDVTMILNFHGRNGSLSIGGTEIHPAAILEIIDPASGQDFLLDVYGCEAGKKIKQDESLYHQMIKDGQKVFINSGGKVTGLKRSMDDILKSHDEEDPVRIMLERVLSNPETIKYVEKSGGKVSFFKKTRLDLSETNLDDASLTEFLLSQIEECVAFFKENGELDEQKAAAIQQEFSERVNSEAVAKYRLNGFLMEMNHENIGNVERYLASHPELLHFIDDGTSMMHHLAAEGNVALLDIFLKFLPADHLSPRDGTPLQEAVMNGKLDAARRLLDAGANPNHYAGGGVLMLIEAVDNGDVNMVRLLLERGADVYQKNEEDSNALDWVMNDAEQTPENAEIIKILREHIARNPAPEKERHKRKAEKAPKAEVGEIKRKSSSRAVPSIIHAHKI